MDSREGPVARSHFADSAGGFGTGGGREATSTRGLSSCSRTRFWTEGFCFRAQSSSHLIAAALVANRFLKRKSSILLRRLSSTMKLRRVLLIVIYVNIDYIYHMY